jgi:hypothetical protein
MAQILHLRHYLSVFIALNFSTLIQRYLKFPLAELGEIYSSASAEVVN